MIIGIRCNVIVCAIVKYFMDKNWLNIVELDIRSKENAQIKSSEYFFHLSILIRKGHVGYNMVK